MSSRAYCTRKKNPPALYILKENLKYNNVRLLPGDMYVSTRDIRVPENWYSIVGNQGRKKNERVDSDAPVGYDSVRVSFLPLPIIQRRGSERTKTTGQKRTGRGVSFPGPYIDSLCSRVSNGCQAHWNTLFCLLQEGERSIPWAHSLT